MTRSKLNRVHLLSGGKPLPSAAVLAGMRGLEQEILRESRRDWSRQLEATKRLNKICAPLVSIIRDGATDRDPSFHPPRSGGKERRLPRPRARREKERIYLGSLGALVPPPYDYSWILAGGGGAVQIANASTGELSFGMDAFGDNNYNVSAGCAVGIYFRPVTDSGRLSVWAEPSFYEMWSDSAIFASAHSDGFIALYIAEYDSAGKFLDAVVNQHHTLWSDDSHLSDSGQHEKSNPGYSMTASCSVKQSSQYVIWVWIGGRASAHHWSGGSASAASAMSAFVPAITWELT